MNNAGVYRARMEKTEEGLEKTMVVNHLSHFLLTHLVVTNLESERDGPWKLESRNLLPPPFVGPFSLNCALK